MKMCLPMLIVLVCSAVAPATEFWRSSRGFAGELQDKGDQKYSIEVAINGTPHEWKLLNGDHPSFVNVHASYADDVNDNVVAEVVLGLRGDLSGGLVTADVFGVVMAVDKDVAQPWMGSTLMYSEREAVVTKIADGVYQHGDKSLLFSQYGGRHRAAIEAASVSGDPIKIGGLGCYRGDPTDAATFEEFFVLETLVD